jgi:hypothetical protein
MGFALPKERVWLGAAAPEMESPATATTLAPARTIFVRMILCRLPRARGEETSSPYAGRMSER